MSDPNLITKQDKDGFLKVLKNERPYKVWILFLSSFVFDRKTEPGMDKVIEELNNFGSKKDFSDD